jgi:antitoxin PrlF
MSYYDKLADMRTITVRLEKSGRVLIPVAVRRQLGLKEGESDLLLQIDATPIRVSTRAQAVKRIQEWAARTIEPGRSLSKELMEERRQEAQRESDEL